MNEAVQREEIVSVLRKHVNTFGVPLVLYESQYVSVERFTRREVGHNLTLPRKSKARGSATNFLGNGGSRDVRDAYGLRDAKIDE